MKLSSPTTCWRGTENPQATDYLCGRTQTITEDNASKRIQSTESKYEVRYWKWNGVRVQRTSDKYAITWRKHTHGHTKVFTKTLKQDSIKNTSNMQGHNMAIVTGWRPQWSLWGLFRQPPRAPKKHIRIFHLSITKCTVVLPCHS